MPLILILLLAVFQCSTINYLITNPDYYQLGSYSWGGSDFRTVRLGDVVVGLDSLDTGMVTILMVGRDHDFTGLKDTRYNNRLLVAARPADYRKLKYAYGTILGDLKYFPTPESRSKGAPEAVLEDSWMNGRGHVSSDGDGGGRGDGQAESGQEDEGQTDNGQEDSGWQNSPKHRHEGCNIIGAKIPPGYYPVASMADGVIEEIGWLEMGGWRIGVRVPGGIYLYYVHLCDCARDLREGDRVKAGRLIGYIGDTGHGKTGGTRGNFDVYLHVGIYIKTDHNKKTSVSPY